MEAWLSGLRRPPRKRKASKASAGSNPAASARKVVWQTTREELKGLADTGKMLRSSVVIVDGVIVKNRFGLPGANIGGSIFVWDNERLK